ncbi:MAG: hypothetical protein IJ828_00865 [Treponema sp.]|nr:hypothetical protein [Treponema sp.]
MKSLKTFYQKQRTSSTRLMINGFTRNVILLRNTLATLHLVIAAVAKEKTMIALIISRRMEMICKDCLHYEVCKPTLPTPEEQNPKPEPIRAENCIKFKDRKQYVQLPCMAMIEQHLVNGKFVHNSLQNNNGKYAVLYIDKNKSNIPLIDICGKSPYMADEAKKRLEELTQ